MSEDLTRNFFSRNSIRGEIHDLYLMNEIDTPDQYAEVFDLMRNCRECDTIRIFINSTGGDLFTAIQMISILKKTEANVEMHVEGACMSAATLILMFAKIYTIAEHSALMFHDYSGEIGGKGGEMADQILHEKTWSESLFRDSYRNFLTEKEIKSMLDGKEIWMYKDEVEKRLNKRIKMRLNDE
jgi:ATP-dependent Clp protease, protease subunit